MGDEILPQTIPRAFVISSVRTEIFNPVFGSDLQLIRSQQWDPGLPAADFLLKYGRFCMFDQRVTGSQNE